MSADYRVVVDPDADNNPHSAAIRFTGSGHRVLEVGCSAGYVTEHLVARGNTVVGVELDPVAAEEARRFAERVHVADIDRTPLSQIEQGPFDVIILGDVLEHLQRPDLALADAATLLAPDGRFVISVPNVGHVDVRMMLLQGEWGYQDDGLLDRTHLRWFTRRSLAGLLDEAGFVAVRAERVRTPFGSSNLVFDRAAVPQPLLAYAAADPEAYTLQYVVDARRITGDDQPDALADPGPTAWPAIDDGSAVIAERDALRREVEAWRNSKLVRVTGPLRALYARMRRR